MKKSNSYLQLKKYFEELVKNSNFLESFAGYFRRELIQKDSNDELSAPYLALFEYGVGLSGPEQNTISVRRLKFAIMYNNIPPDEIQQQYEAIDNAEKLVLKVLARIRWDASQEGHFLYNSLIKDSIEIEPVEISMKAFGAECYLEFKNNQSLKMEQEDWKDIDKICQ